MLRDMVRRPLEQVVVLLWLVGLVNLGGRIIDDQLSFAMVFTALLAGLLALHFIVHYRLPGLFFLPGLCGLAAMQVLLKTMGVGLSGLKLAQAVYALATWRFLVYAESRDWLGKAIAQITIRAEGASEFDGAQ
ncbi:MAG: hypothetical protein ACU83P_11265, partial [Gammaproteobacteria bacterium]